MVKPTTSPKQKFIIDISKPSEEGIFDGAEFEKFLHDHIKVEGKAGNLGDAIKVTRDGKKKVIVTANIPFSKRYLKYLTKKYLKKSGTRDFIRVVATSKDNYTLKFSNTLEEEEDDEE
ncbi:60S ribosomal protein L22 [Schizophyllum commune H4-8]|uniref:Ribosomal protein L22e n=1 Tax=Schizophyllum commune (strain H4-8 / FGSC 9210) TaxID=578458 RepID=D8Q1G5_SCHCM|nr:60S ribosomal protein L22 [Schizophyllum commune H4-8]KAI5895413.1 ribosomal protein L22e [Schizophyllum commune H4-8]